MNDAGRQPRPTPASLLGRATAWLLAPLIGVPVALPPALIARFPELGDARWRRGGLPPRVGGWCLLQPTVAAITLWRTVFLAPHTRFDPGLLLHELRHVQQFQGSAWFPLDYILESLRRGYGRNKYEIAANSYAADRLRGHPPARSPRSPGATSPFGDA